MPGEDAASGTVLALELALRDVVNMVDDEPARAARWLPHLAACCSAKPPMRVPGWLARFLAGAVAVAMRTEGRGLSSAKVKRAGVCAGHPSWRDGVQEGPSWREGVRPTALGHRVSDAGQRRDAEDAVQAAWLVRCFADRALPTR